MFMYFFHSTRFLFLLFFLPSKWYEKHKNQFFFISFFKTQIEKENEMENLMIDYNDDQELKLNEIETHYIWWKNNIVNLLLKNKDFAFVNFINPPSFVSKKNITRRIRRRKQHKRKWKNRFVDIHYEICKFFSSFSPLHLL